MTLAPIKFRCPRCSQLLGAPPSKSGRSIRCPKCRAELLVPAGPPATAGPNELQFGPLLDTPSSNEFRTLAGSDADFLNLAPAAQPPSEVAKPIESPPEVDQIPAGDWTNDSIVVFDPPPISPRGVPSDHSVGDVPIPRLFLLGGCLLSLLAVAGAFGSGLLIGKYVWRGP